MIHQCKAKIISEVVAPNKYLNVIRGAKQQTLCLLGKHVDVILDASNNIIEHGNLCNCDCAERFRAIRLPYGVAMDLLK